MVGMFRNVLGLVIVSLCFAQRAMCYEDRLVQSIADDIEIEFAEILREAQLSVVVLREKNISQVRCRISNSQLIESYKWAFCKVDLEVQSQGLKGFRTCPFLYHFNPRKKDLDLFRGDDLDFDRCLKSFINDF
jgi:hypothetical protein